MYLTVPCTNPDQIKYIILGLFNDVFLAVHVIWSHMNRRMLFTERMKFYFLWVVGHCREYRMICVVAKPLIVTGEGFECNAERHSN